MAARSPASLKASWKWTPGAARAINRWRERYKMSQCTFPNKNVSRLLGEGRERGKWPKVFKKWLHFPFSELLLYITRESLSLPRCPDPLTAVLESSISHSWLAGSLCYILLTTGARKGTVSVPTRRAHGFKALVTTCRGEEDWGPVFYCSMPSPDREENSRSLIGMLKIPDHASGLISE